MGGLETLPDAVTIARLVRDVTGEEPRGARPLGSGVTTICWRVETEDRPLVVLIARPATAPAPVDEPRFGGQLAILDALHPVDARVPVPVAWSGDAGLEDLARFDLEWAIEGEVAGAPASTEVPDDAARDLGALLARLHALPTEGFGRVLNTRDAIRGGATDMASGLLERWPDLWPFDGSSLLAHPVARAAPRLLEPIGALREHLLRFGLLARGVPLHADLNSEHIYVNGDRLSAVIDFSDAVIGPPAVDIASFAYFLGWERAGVLLEGYATSTVLRETRLAEAQLFGVAHALHKVRRHSRSQHPERLARALAALEETVDHARRLLRG